jgi:hypothetical protein
VLAWRKSGANDRFLVNPTIRWRRQEWLLRVELSRSPTTQQLALLAHPKLLRTASRSRLRLQSRRGAGKASGPFASFLNPADSPVFRGRLISLAIAG